MAHRKINLLIVSSKDGSAIKQTLQDAGVKDTLSQASDKDAVMGSLSQSPKPNLILLDMTGQDLFAVLRELKSNAEARKIPVVVLATAPDTEKSYELGASSFILRPPNSADLARALSLFKKYWYDIVEIPAV